MTLSEIRLQALAQLGLDQDDLSDYKSSLTGYINDGYDKLLKANKDAHVGDVGYPALTLDSNSPLIPGWAHRYLADYATWMVSRNGSAQKQNKGSVFYSAFSEAEANLKYEADFSVTSMKFKNHLLP